MSWPGKCKFCAMAPLAFSVEIAALARTHDLDLFAATLPAICDAHLDQLGGAIGVAVYEEVAA